MIKPQEANYVCAHAEGSGCFLYAFLENALLYFLLASGLLNVLSTDGEFCPSASEEIIRSSTQTCCCLLIIFFLDFFSVVILSRAFRCQVCCLGEFYGGEL